MKLSKEERGEIYLEVAEIFANDVSRYGFACYEFEMLLSKHYGYDRYQEDHSYIDMLEEFFPEFLLFKKLDIGTWWASDDQTRAIALLLSHQMCKD
jgi:hypothetical protein